MGARLVETFFQGATCLLLEIASLLLVFIRVFNSPGSTQNTVRPEGRRSRGDGYKSLRQTDLATVPCAIVNEKSNDASTLRGRRCTPHVHAPSTPGMPVTAWPSPAHPKSRPLKASPCMCMKSVRDAHDLVVRSCTNNNPEITVGKAPLLFEQPMPGPSSSMMIDSNGNRTGV